MQLAIWNIPPAEFLVSGLTAGASSVSATVERHDARTCLALLRKGFVDVALLPSLQVLMNPDLFDVLPGVALSTWKYPYARLVLRKGLEHVASVAFDPAYAQEALVARIILKEHYGQVPAFVPMEGATVGRLLQGAEDGVLVAGAEAPSLHTDDLVLNLGEEWYELANYPMVWGLFAVRKDEAMPALVAALLETIRAAEEQRPVWTQAREMPPPLHAFFADDLRLRLDDLAMASLTEFRQYLYYYDVTDEIPDLPLYLLPEDDDAGDERAPLL